MAARVAAWESWYDSPMLLSGRRYRVVPNLKIRSRTMKKNKVLPIAVEEDDLKILDDILSRITFPPSRSVLARGLMRSAAMRLLKGRLSLRAISHIANTEDIRAEVGR